MPQGHPTTCKLIFKVKHLEQSPGLFLKTIWFALNINQYVCVQRILCRKSCPQLVNFYMSSLVYKLISYPIPQAFHYLPSHRSHGILQSFPKVLAHDLLDNQCASRPQSVFISCGMTLFQGRMRQGPGENLVAISVTSDS